MTYTKRGAELYKQYYNILLFSYNDNIPEEITRLLAKKCALISVKLVLESMTKEYDAFNGESYDYWKNVIKTIEGL